jgi:hypothetical protein
MSFLGGDGCVHVSMCEGGGGGEARSTVTLQGGVREGVPTGERLGRGSCLPKVPLAARLKFCSLGSLATRVPATAAAPSSPVPWPFSWAKVPVMTFPGAASTFMGPEDLAAATAFGMANIWVGGACPLAV